MAVGESLTRTLTGRERAEAVLAQEAQQELPKSIGAFSLHTELAEKNGRLCQILNLTMGSPLLLRADCFDVADDGRLGLRPVDVLRPLVSDLETSDRDFEDLLSLCQLSGAFRTKILVDRSAGEIVLFGKNQAELSPKSNS